MRGSDMLCIQSRHTARQVCHGRHSPSLPAVQPAPRLRFSPLHLLAVSQFWIANGTTNYRFETRPHFLRVETLGLVHIGWGLSWPSEIESTASLSIYLRARHPGLSMIWWGISCQRNGMGSRLQAGGVDAVLFMF
jgi:hypothetical protein